LFLTGFANKAYAAVFEKNIDTYKNPTNLNPFTAIPDAWKSAMDTTSSAINWIKDLPPLPEMTINLTNTLYSLLTELILRTPLWLFSGEWFAQTTYLFSIMAVSIVSFLTIVEGIKKYFRKESVDVLTISKRWFLVAGLSSIAPMLFQKSFALLNWFTGWINSIGGEMMFNVQSGMPFDYLILLLFDLVLLSQVVPILLQNGRRFFDIMCLAVTTPLALTTFIFDPLSHIFRQWWSSLKALSLVQLVYAAFLLLLGLFIYGAPTPSDFLGFLTKMLIIIGAFARLKNPPLFIKRHLDQGGTIGDIYNEGAKSRKSFIKDMKSGKGVIKNLTNPTKAMYNMIVPKAPEKVNPTSRMSRIHGK